MNQRADTQQTDTRISEALAAHRRGWALTPLRGKQPILDGWQRQPQPTEDQVLAWAKRGNVGLRTGPVSGVLVIDEDEPGAALALFGGAPPLTPTAITGSGGRHYYFEAPDPCPGNSAGKLAPKVDVRGAGGQVVYPGSIHPGTGKPYTWADDLSPDDVPLAPVPPDLVERLTAPAPASSTPPQPASTATVRLDRYVQAALDREAAAVREAPEGARNSQLNTSAYSLGQLVPHLLPQDVVERELDAAAQACGLSGREVSATIRSGITSGMATPRHPEIRPVGSRTTSRAPAGAHQEPDPAPAEPEGSPEVLVPGPHVDSDGHYIEVGNHDFAAAVIDALPAGLLYRRGEIAGEIVGPPGERRFRAMTNGRLRVLVDEHIRLVRWVRLRTDPEPRKQFMNCNRDHASILLDCAAVHPHVRDLRMIVSYPVFLGADLQLAAPGWNDAYGVFYDEPAELRDLDTAVEPEEAWRILEDLTVDFPWKTTSDRQNFFGLLLTPLLRQALNGNCPMHLLLSPLERTGKSKLAEQVLGRAILGRPTSSMQLTGSDEERDKRIIGQLMRGETVIHLDNVREYVDSAALASLLTSSVYSGRLLGRSEILELPNLLTIVASGNNVRATGEIVKRTVPIQLQPADDHPEQRSDFKHPDLPTYVAGQRRRVLGALIAMVLRWRDGDRMAPRVPPMGGFEEWSRLVGGVLASNFFLEWRATHIDWMRGADPKGEDLRSLVEVWSDLHGDRLMTAQELLAIAEANNLFPYSLRSNSERGRQVAFSRSVLSRHLDTPVLGWCIRARGETRNRMYYLERL